MWTAVWCTTLLGIRLPVVLPQQRSGLGLRTTHQLRCERQRRTVPQAKRTYGHKRAASRTPEQAHRNPRPFAGVSPPRQRRITIAVYIGIDWSATKHDICVLNEIGGVIATTVVPHTADGLLKLEALRHKLGVASTECLIGIETAHTLVIDFLWARDYSQIYVIPPNVVNSRRGRYRQSGARTDTSDALLVADLLRTDRARLHPWRPDTLLTQQLRNRVGLVSHLTQTAVRPSSTIRIRRSLLLRLPA